MKRLCSFALSLILLIMTCVSTFAEDFETSHSAITLVTLTVPSTYTVSVPISLSLSDDNEDGQYDGSYMVGCQGILVANDSVIIKPISSTFELVGENTGTKVSASVTQAITKFVRVATDDTMLAVNNDSLTETSGFISAKILKADVYTGTLTMQCGDATKDVIVTCDATNLVSQGKYEKEVDNKTSIIETLEVDASESFIKENIASDEESKDVDTKGCNLVFTVTSTPVSYESVVNDNEYLKKKEDDYTHVLSLDLSVKKTLYNGETGSAISSTGLTELPKKIGITFSIPTFDTEKFYVKNYSAVRIHDGAIEEIDMTYDEKSQTFTIGSSKFSSFLFYYSLEDILLKPINPNDPLDVRNCICDTQCVENHVNNTCVVCHNDYTNCVGEASLILCTCSDKCSHDDINVSCSICSKDYSKCQGSEHNNSSCTCTNKCDSDHINTNCEVCKDNLNNCESTIPYPTEHKCMCLTKCDDTHIDYNCDVCRDDFTKCVSNVPFKPVETCICSGTKCSQNSVDTSCPVCSNDYRRCEVVVKPESTPTTPISPSCTCSHKCSSDDVNISCELCRNDYTDCVAKKSSNSSSGNDDSSSNGGSSGHSTYVPSTYVNMIFLDWNGKVLGNINALSGSFIGMPLMSNFTSGNRQYVFMGWTPMFNGIVPSSNQIYIATYYSMEIDNMPDDMREAISKKPNENIDKKSKNETPVVKEEIADSSVDVADKKITDTKSTNADIIDTKDDVSTQLEKSESIVKQEDLSAEKQEELESKLVAEIEQEVSDTNSQQDDTPIEVPTDDDANAISESSGFHFSWLWLILILLILLIIGYIVYTKVSNKNNEEEK